MANQIARNFQQFPPQSPGALGPVVETHFFDDGTAPMTVTPGSDGALPPGVSTQGATVKAAPAAPVVSQ